MLSAYLPGGDSYEDHRYDAMRDAQIDDAIDAPAWYCRECGTAHERTPGDDLTDLECGECGEINHA